jgi:hypothetical protein
MKCFLAENIDSVVADALSESLTGRFKFCSFDVEAGAKAMQSSVTVRVEVEPNGIDLMREHVQGFLNGFESCRKLTAR